MSKSFQNEQEESATASQVEHTLWPSAVQLQILHSFAIYPQPMIDIGEFASRVLPLDLTKAVLVDSGEHWPERKPKNGALRSTPGAAMPFSSDQFA
jgi:hypothetical protein